MLYRAILETFLALCLIWCNFKSMGKKTIIKLKNLDLFHGKKQILKDINLTIKESEIITIIGPNGSGKTSLLSVLAGIKPVNKKGCLIKQDVRVAYMPQKITLNPHLPITVFAFLRLTNDANKIESIAHELNISNILDKQIYEISGGELQRVLLANCFLAQPQLMILDEPVSSMDINSAELFYKKISDFGQSTKCATIMASHDLYVVMKNTDRVVCLDARICCQGCPSEVIAHQEFIKLFGKNVAFYQHQHKS